MSVSSKTNETYQDNLVELFTQESQGSGNSPASDQEDGPKEKAKPTNGRLERLLNLCWPEEADDRQAIARRAVDAIEIYRSLEPQDKTESLICEQMVGNHLAANRCLKRASTATHSETVGRYCRIAAQLQAQFLKQAEFLEKQRARKPRSAAVEHVNVESGGQAIVGHVETKGPSYDTPTRRQTAPRGPTLRS